jgi:hypothetical protein
MTPTRLHAPVELENREALNRIRLPEPYLAEYDMPRSMPNSMVPNSMLAEGRLE